MTELTESGILSYQEHLQKLEPLCRSLAEAIRRSGLGAEDALAAFRQCLGADCVQCHTHISGEQLFALSQPASPDTNPRLNRLHHGYCAAAGCNSYYYRLGFQPHPKLDWRKLLKESDVIQDEFAPAPIAGSHSDWAPKLRTYLTDRAVAIRVGFGLASVFLLLIVRQWYYGGTIPIIRQAEHFHVAQSTNVAPFQELEGRTSDP
jgi:hypothetical protein